MLREALYPLGALGQLFVSLQEAEALAEALGDPHRLGWVAVCLLAYFVQAFDPDRALASGQRALGIAAHLGNIGLTVMAQYYLGLIYSRQGDSRRAIAFHRKNVTCLHGDLLQERFGQYSLPSVHSRSFLVASLAECGDFPEGKVPAEEGVQIAEAADHPYGRVIAYWAMGFRALRQGDLPQAIPVLERALALVQGTHIRLAIPWVAAPLGAACALAGRTAEALPLLERAVEQAVAMGLRVDHALQVIWLGEAYLLVHCLDEAATQAQRPLEFSRAHQERGHEAYALRLLGEVTAHRTPPAAEQAEADYRQALALADELGMRPLRAHCHRGLGILSGTQGQPELAHAELSAAIALYRAMDTTFWLPQTKAALAQMG